MKELSIREDLTICIAGNPPFEFSCLYISTRGCFQKMVGSQSAVTEKLTFERLKVLEEMDDKANKL